MHIEHVCRADANDLITANYVNQTYHTPWVIAFTDQAGFDHWFERSNSGPNVGLVAREQTTNELVGVININEIVRGPYQSAYLCCYGMRKWSGQGLMSQALRLAVAFAFRDLELHRLEVMIQPKNLPAIALARNLSFQQEGLSPRFLKLNGVWHDHQRWALVSNSD